MQRVHRIAALVLVLSAFSVPARAQEDLQYIAADFAPIPGSAGRLFQERRFRGASLSGNGDVMFNYWIVDQGPGIWRFGANGLELVAGPPDADTGLTRLVDGRPTGDDITAQITIDGTMYTEGAFDGRQGYWLLTPGSAPTAIAIEGEAAPTGTWTRLSRYFVNQRGLFFQATDAGGEGLFHFDGTNVQPLLRVGGPMPQLPNATITRISGFRANDNETVATIVVGDDGSGMPRSGVLIDTGSGWTGAFNEARALENVSGYGSRIVISPLGTVIVDGGFWFEDMNGAFSSRDAIWRVQGSARELLVRNQQPIGNLTYDNLGDLNITADGRLLMTAGLRDANFDRVSTIVEENGGLQVTHRQGDMAPGGGRYDSFADVEVSQSGRLAVIARIDGVQSILLSNASGNLERLLTEGDMAEVGTGTPVTITGMTMNLANFRRPFSASGRFCFNALQRGTAAIACTQQAEPTPVDLVGLEVVQVVQDWKNSVELIEGKKTYVRAFFSSPTRLPVQVQLRARRNGQELAGSPLKTLNWADLHLAGQNPAATRRFSGNHGLWFLPADWRMGDVEFEVESTFGNLNIACKEVAGPMPNDCKASVQFRSVPTLPIRLLSVQWKKDNMTFAPSRREMANLAARLEASFPQGKLRWTRDEVTTRLDLSRDNADSRLLAAVKSYRLAKNCGAGCPDIFYGATRNANFGGLGARPGGASIGEIRTSGYGTIRHTHEIGHNLGIQHAAYCGAVAETSLAVPNIGRYRGMQVPLLGPLMPDNDAVFGFDEFAGIAIEPGRYFDVMGYCIATGKHRWPSKFTYELMLQNVRARLGQPPPTDPQQNLLVFTGTVSANDQAFIGDATQVTSSAQLFSGASDYSLVANDANGAAMTTTPIEVETIDRDAPGPDGAAPFEIQQYLVAIPADPAIRSVDITYQGNVVATKAASANAPMVTLLQPNGGESLSQDEVTVSWTGSDADGDTLLYRLEYSADDGTTWTAVSLDTPETSITIPRRTFAASNAARLRVVASDGFNVAQDESDAAFSVQTHAPEVFIIKPTDNLQVFGDQQVRFQAVILETTTETATLSWSSDIDGEFSTAEDPSIPASQLSEGTHNITVSAQTPRGAAATDSITLVVQRNVPDDLNDLVVSIDETAPNPVAPGGSVNLRVLVTSAGPAVEATNVSLQVELPVELSLVSLSSPGGTCMGNTCTWTTLSELATVDVVATALSPGEAVARFVVSGNGVDPNPNNNADEQSVLIDEDAPPPPDAGTSDLGGGADAGSTGPDADTPGGDAGTAPNDEDGCGCTATSKRGSTTTLLSLLILAFGLRRRRRNQGC